MQNAIRTRPANYTILHKILQNLRQSFFRTHCVTLTENMRLVIQCKLNTVLLPRPPIEFVKHWNIIRVRAVSKGSRACFSCGAVNTTSWRRARCRASSGRRSSLTRRPPAAPRAAPRAPPAPAPAPANSCHSRILWKYANSCLPLGLHDIPDRSSTLCNSNSRGITGGCERTSRVVRRLAGRRGAEKEISAEPFDTVWMCVNCEVVRSYGLRGFCGWKIELARYSLGRRPSEEESVPLCCPTAADIEASRSAFLSWRLMARSRNTWAFLMYCYVLFMTERLR